IVFRGPFVDSPWQTRHPRNAWTEGAGEPSILVDAAAPHDVEELSLAPPLGVRIGEGVGHADAVERVLRHAVDDTRWRDVHDLIDGRCDVDDVMKLGTGRAIGSDPRRPCDRH